MKSDITVIILTWNEEKNIRRALKHAYDFAERIIVVDSGSTDNTVNIAKEYGVDIYFHPWKHYADQFNWALSNTEITTKWVYRLDADEVPTEELKEEILAASKANKDTDVNAFVIRYKMFFMDRFLLHGGAYPMLKIALFKHKYAAFENRAMGEHIILTEGRCNQLSGECLHYDCKNLDSYINKHNHYASREVIDYFDRKKRLDMQAKQAYKNAERTKKLRDKVYYKLPLFFRAKIYFWFRYYFQLGFLDGKAGKIYCFIQAYFYRFAVDAKIYEHEVNERKNNEN